MNSGMWIAALLTIGAVALYLLGMAKDEEKKLRTVTIEGPPKVNVSANSFTSSSSGTVSIFQTITMPDGKPMRLLNKEVFYRALEKSKKNAIAGRPGRCVRAAPHSRRTFGGASSSPS